MDNIASPWGPKERLVHYAKTVREIGVRGFLDRSRARHSGNCTVALRTSDHPLYVRKGTSDLLVFDQIFVDREYRCLDGLTNVRTIVDAGANVGYSSAYLLTRFSGSRVIALEPDPGNFETLERNLAPWESRAVPLQAALWSEVTALSFDTDTLREGAEWGRQVEASDEGNVPAFDVPYLMRGFGLDTIDLLKVDIEGAERAVFSSPDLSWLDKVENIVIELHGQECSDTFHRAIADAGYVVSRCDELTVCLGARGSR